MELISIRKVVPFISTNSHNDH